MAKQQQQSISSSSSSTITTNTNDGELCNWELVNQSDCSDAFSDFDVQSFDDLLLDLVDSSSSPRNDVVDDDVVVAEEVVKEEEVKIDDDDAVNYVVNHVNLINYDVNHVLNVAVDLINYGDNHHQGYFGNFTAHPYVNVDDVVDDVDEDDDDVDDEVDDDLVPWEMKGIYMKQRMKKSEKKYITNMCKSRKVFKTVRARYAKAY